MMARLDMTVVAENVYKFLLKYIFCVYYNHNKSHELKARGHA